MVICGYKDWAWLSQSKRIASFLRSSCDFWEAIEGESWPMVFKSLDESMLKSITPDCVLKIPKTLAQNLDKISLLADDAFSKHQAGQLSFPLQHLSPAQISQLSKQIKAVGNTFSHVLYNVTLEELQTLDFLQFQFLYESQWASVPSNFKSRLLGWQIQASQARVLDIAVKLKNNQGNSLDEKAINCQTDDFNTAERALSFILKMNNDPHQKIPEPALDSFIAFIRNSDLRKAFSKVFEGSALLKPAIICLIRNSKELQDYTIGEFKKMNSVEEGLVISNNHQSGFDRSTIIKLLKKTPELFAAPNAWIDSQGMDDRGGPIRALTDQLLKDIKRDLVVPFTRGGGPLLHQGLGNSMEVGYTKYEGAKFGWGISRDVGLVVGLVFGKALQLEIKLPFALDWLLYGLIIDIADEVIENYYRITYSQEISKYEQDIRTLFTNGNFEELLEILTRPESLRFTELSVEVEAEAAKSDATTKANLWGCGKKDCYNDILELKSQDFVEDYTRAILERILGEFTGFIRELVRGLGIALPPVREFDSSLKPFLHPFAEFLPELLNAEPISPDELNKKITIFGGEIKVVFKDKEFLASKVLSAFINSLNESQVGLICLEFGPVPLLCH